MEILLKLISIIYTGTHLKKAEFYYTSNRTNLSNNQLEEKKNFFPIVGDNDKVRCAFYGGNFKNFKKVITDINIV